MSGTFNGYHVWLSIPPNEQPPNHYRLLGIAVFETDLDVIDHAADRQMAHVRTFQSGRHGALSQQILNELAAARLSLLHPERKTAYDEELRAKLASGPNVAPVSLATVPMGTVPVANAPVAAVPFGQSLPTAKPVVSKVAPRATPFTKPKPRAPVRNLGDEIALDLEPSPIELPRVTSTFQGRGKRRSSHNRNSSWQGSAVMGVTAGILVIGCFLLYYFLKDLDWRQFLEGSLSAPEAPSTNAAPSTPSPAPASGQR